MTDGHRTKKSFKCPYSDSTVWCNRRDNEKTDKMACDSCPIILMTGATA